MTSTRRAAVPSPARRRLGSTLVCVLLALAASSASMVVFDTAASAAAPDGYTSTGPFTPALPTSTAAPPGSLASAGPVAVTHGDGRTATPEATTGDGVNGIRSYPTTAAVDANPDCLAGLSARGSARDCSTRVVRITFPRPVVNPQLQLALGGGRFSDGTHCTSVWENVTFSGVNGSGPGSRVTSGSVAGNVAFTANRLFMLDSAVHDLGPCGAPPTAAHSYVRVSGLVSSIDLTYTYRAMVTDASGSTATRTVGPTGGVILGVLVPMAELVIAKDAPADVAPGGRIQWTLRVTNTGPGPSHGFVLDDVVPSTVTDAQLVSAPAGCALVAGDLSCASAPAGCVASPDPMLATMAELTCAPDTAADATVLAAGATFGPIVLSATAPPSCGATVVNTARVRGVDSQLVTADDTASAQTLTRTCSLRVEKSSDATSATRAGDTVTYTVRATNTGSDYTVAAPAVLTDDLTQVLDDGVYTGDATSDRGSAPSFSTPRLSWSGPLAAGESVTLTYSVTLRDGGDTVVRNVAFEGAGPAPQCDPPTATGVDPVTGVPCDEVTTLLPDPRVRVVKSVDPASGTTVRAGQQLTYTVTFTNRGGATARVAHEDVLTGVLDDATVTAPPRSSDDTLATSRISAGHFQVTGALPVGARVTVSYTVRVEPDGRRGDNLLTNVVVPVGSAPPSRCSDDSLLCTENPVAEVSVTKSASPPSGTPVLAGQQVTYTLAFTNSGQAAGQVRYEDVLTDVLDDATLTTQPTSSSTAVSASAVAGGRFTVSGILGAGATARVSYAVTVRAAAERGDGLLANVVVPPDSRRGTTCAVGDTSCTTNPVSGLSVVKSVDPRSGTVVSAGDRLSYTITIANTGTKAAGVDLVDHLGAALDDASLVPGSLTTDGLSATGPDGDVMHIRGELSADAVAVVRYDVTVRGDRRGDGRILNVVLPAGAQTADDCGSSPTRVGGQAANPLCTVNLVADAAPASALALPWTGVSLWPALLGVLLLTGGGLAATAHHRLRRVDDEG